MAYYVFDDAKNLFEGMTKEEIIAAIAQATGVTPASIDDGFITTIQEQNAQHGVKLWVGSQNEYNAIAAPDENTLYVVTDPTETNELQNQINQLQAEVNELAVQNTENASGFKIETQTYSKEVYSTDSSLNHNFTVPLTAVVLEASFIIGGSMETTDNVSISETDGETTKNVNVLARFKAPDSGQEAVIKLVYAYPEAVDLSELTDIRVGYDGTVYGSAGEAVRKQAFETRFHDYIKEALLNLLAHVAYIDGNGRQYYNALEAAMYMTAGVTSITAVFNQGENVIYDNDSLDYLKQYLTVTAYFEDNTSEVVTAYTLSGTLTAGTSTITVAYMGKTATFTVNVTHSDVPREYTAYDYVRYTGTSKQTAAAAEMILTKAFNNLNALVVDFDFMPMIAQEGAAAQLLGGRLSTGNNIVAFYSRTDTKRVSAFSHATALGINDIPSVTVGNLVHVNLNPNAESPSTLTVDSFSDSQAWTNTTAIDQPFAYFGTIEKNKTTNMTLSNFAAIGVLRLYDLANILVGEYIPCVRNSDNVIGVYDTVTETFYTASTIAYTTIGNASCEYSVGNWGT